MGWRLSQKSNHTITGVVCWYNEMTNVSPKKPARVAKQWIKTTRRCAVFPHGWTNVRRKKRLFENGEQIPKNTRNTTQTGKSAVHTNKTYAVEKPTGWGKKKRRSLKIPVELRKMSWNGILENLSFCFFTEIRESSDQNSAQNENNVFPTQFHKTLADGEYK